jgi:hypothetical protein
MSTPPRKPSMRQKAAAFDALQTIYKGDLFAQVTAICLEALAIESAKRARAEVPTVPDGAEAAQQDKQ